MPRVVAICWDGFCKQSPELSDESVRDVTKCHRCWHHRGLGQGAEGLLMFGGLLKLEGCWCLGSAEFERCAEAGGLLKLAKRCRSSEELLTNSAHGSIPWDTQRDTIGTARGRSQGSNSLNFQLLIQLRQLHS